MCLLWVFLNRCPLQEHNEFCSQASVHFHQVPASSRSKATSVPHLLPPSSAVGRWEISRVPISCTAGGLERGWDVSNGRQHTEPRKAVPPTCALTSKCHPSSFFILLSLTLGSHSLTPPLTFTHTSEANTTVTSQLKTPAMVWGGGSKNESWCCNSHCPMGYSPYRSKIAMQNKQNKTHEALEENL